MQDTDAPYETEDPTPSAAAGGVGYGLEYEAMGEDLDCGSNVETSNPEAGHCSVVEDSGAIQVGEVRVPLVTQPHECKDEISQEVIGEGVVVTVDPLQIVADREHLSGSSSKSIFKSNQGGKAVGRQRSRKLRQGGSVKVPESRLSPSESLTPYDNSSADNENRTSTKTQVKRTPSATIIYDDNDPSTARRQSQRGDGERSQGTPNRRLAFAPVPPSELNIRMGTTPNPTPEKYTPSKTVAVSNNVSPIQVASTPSVEELGSPVIFLQQAGPITAQVLTIGGESDPESEYFEGNVSVSAFADCDEEESIDAALRRTSAELYGDDDSSEHHDSDKENVPFHEMFLPRPSCMTLRFSQGFDSPINCTREPLQTLFSAPSPSMYLSPDIFTTPTASQKLVRARFQVEAGRHWQMIVDTNCLLDAESLEALKLLEGIRGTCLVIPNIVVRELDFLQKKPDWNVRSCSALQWIVACTSRMPSWIHVQSFRETTHLATTPVSPSLFSRGLHSHVSENDMIHATVHDHVLECALFQQRMPDGRVAILTDDITLTIKARAENLVVDTAINFSDSLLNPYSDRFVYAGSTPIGRSSGRLHEILYDGLSTPRTPISSTKWATPGAVRPISRSDTPRPTSRANFSLWRKSQPLGLQALLQ